MLIIKFFRVLKDEYRKHKLLAVITIWQKVANKLISFIPKMLKFNILCITYKFILVVRGGKIRNYEFEKQRQMGIDKIPIFIISFNRLSYIQQIIGWLEKYGLKNINIIDNASTFEPLLNYYKTLPYKIFYMEQNQGHLVFWKNQQFSKYRKGFYVVTDPDVVPVEECPSDFLQVFFNILFEFPFLAKAGFSLKIDDLPLDGMFTSEVLNWEKQYNEIKIKDKNAFYAAIDTTFALYPPETIACKDFFRAIRMDYPYQMRHLPWYKRKDDISEEDQFYTKNKTNGWWDVGKGLCTMDK